MSIKNLASNCKNADYSFGPSDSTRRIPRRKHFQPNINSLRNSVTRKNVGNYSRIDTTVLRAASCHSVSSDTRKNLQFHPNLRRPSRRVEFKKSWTRFFGHESFHFGRPTLSTLAFFPLRPSPIVHEAVTRELLPDFLCPGNSKGEKLRPTVADNCLANWPTPHLICPLNASWTTVYVLTTFNTADNERNSSVLRFLVAHDTVCVI